MDQPTRKPMLTPAKPLIDAGFEEGGEPRLPKPRVVGSNPIARSREIAAGTWVSPHVPLSAIRPKMPQGRWRLSKSNKTTP